MYGISVMEIPTCIVLHVYTVVCRGMYIVCVSTLGFSVVTVAWPPLHRNCTHAIMMRLCRYSFDH